MHPCRCNTPPPSSLNPVPLHPIAASYISIYIYIYIYTFRCHCTTLINLHQLCSISGLLLLACSCQITVRNSLDVHICNDCSEGDQLAETKTRVHLPCLPLLRLVGVVPAPGRSCRGGGSASSDAPEKAEGGNAGCYSGLGGGQGKAGDVR